MTVSAALAAGDRQPIVFAPALMPVDARWFEVCQVIYFLHVEEVLHALVH
jgi:hypothetical protein